MDEKFDLHATLDAVGNAFFSVVCHILFDFALVGMGVAFTLATCATVLRTKGHRFSQPFYVVSRRVGLTCLAVSVPGFACLALRGHLPDSGVYINFSLGFLVLWSMVTIYLCAEEMNYEWFIRGDKGEDEESQTEVLTKTETVVADQAASPVLQSATGEEKIESAATSEHAEGADHLYETAGTH